MSGQKRPCETSGSSSGAAPEKRRERDGGEDAAPGVSAAAGGSTAVETVIKLGGVSNSVRDVVMVEGAVCPFHPLTHPPITLFTCV